MGNILTPGFFDALVLIVVAIGSVLAVWRIYQDLRSGPRWTDAPPAPPAPTAEKTLDQPEQTENVK